MRFPLIPSKTWTQNRPKFPMKMDPFVRINYRRIVHSSFTVRTCNTKLSDLTHNACLGLSIAWACLPNAAADLANMKGNIMDVNSAISAIAMSEQNLHFSRELVVLRVLKSLLSVVLGDGGGRRWCGRGALLCQRSIQRISQLQVGGELVSLTTSCSYVFPFWMRSDRWRYHVHLQCASAREADDTTDGTRRIPGERVRDHSALPALD